MEEVPLVQQLQAKFAGTVTILGISTDTSIPRVDRTIKERRMTWPILADGKGFEGAIPTAYHVQGTPDVFVIDSEGRIFKHLGSATEIESTIAAARVAALEVDVRSAAFNDEGWNGWTAGAYRRTPRN
jgi:peroxiredoxin